ncbi:putative acetyltransferase [Marinilabilia salmonicolor]|jgi:putative acetyltransferase|uniref:N-acetyltransferase n=1 Tax=Marinilabilia salmonicolor TaxID=989 RepID=UPI000D04B14A|nr:N-acetyltransferase [Marinilabilia salmonicolor]PRY90322.1 putative acetyltransferase [Marinilabilia salmonicolor]
MIRKLQDNQGEIAEVCNLWLEGSIQSHDFVSESYWQSKLEDMKTHYLPNSETYVLEEDGIIKGFISLVDDKLAALFVAPEYQGKGVGHELLLHAQRLSGNLKLNVYTENSRAVTFYARRGFRFVGLQMDPNTGCEEFVLEWKNE